MAATCHFPLTPAGLVDRIGALVRRYRTRPEPQLARAIGAHLKALCRHPDFRPGHEAWCRLRHLAVYFDCLAEREEGR